MPHRKIEKILFAKVELWLVLLLILVGSLSVVMFGNTALKGKQEGKDAAFLAKKAYEIARFPDSIFTLIREGIQFDRDRGLVEKNPQILDGTDAVGFSRNDQNFKDGGLLLISSYNPEHRISTVYLYDLSTNTTLWEWIPDYSALVESIPSYKNLNQFDPTYASVNRRELYRTQHPLLLDDGSIVFSSGEGPLVRLSKDSEIIWTLDNYFHHSIERTRDGHLIVPLARQRGPYRDDGFAIVSLSGKILQEYSMIDILESNGHRGLLWGVGKPESDLIHLNDAEEIHASDEWVQAGDIMLSSRHLSTVLLYRPSKNKVIWSKTGPWLAQHDVDYLGDGRFVIFGNDLARGHQWTQTDHSNVHVYDMKTDTITQPYHQVFRKNRLRTATQGLQRILRNGDAFIELQNSGILMRVSPTNIRWSYTNKISEDEVGIVHWSRYLYRHELNLDWLEK